MTNGKLRGAQIGQIRPDSMVIDPDCHFAPQARINGYRLELRSMRLTALAGRVRLLRGTFDFRGRIGRRHRDRLGHFQGSGGLRQR